MISIVSGCVTVVCLSIALVAYLKVRAKQVPSNEAPEVPATNKDAIKARWKTAFQVLRWIIVIAVVVFMFRSCLNGRVMEQGQLIEQMKAEQAKRWVFIQAINHPLWQRELEITQFHDSVATMEFRVLYQVGERMREATYSWDKSKPAGQWCQPEPVDSGIFCFEKQADGSYSGYHTSGQFPTPVPTVLRRR